MLLKEKGEKLLSYKVDAENKKHEFWQRGSLATHLYSRGAAFQKLKYIPACPVRRAQQSIGRTLACRQAGWQLTKKNIHVTTSIGQRSIMN